MKGLDETKVINSVLPGSIAEEIGLDKGDVLVGIDGKAINDVFEYRLMCATEELLLSVMKPSGEVWEFEIEKDYQEDLGIVFEYPLLAKEKGCTNKCIFCFIDQMPPNMRETLYFKDDDSRLSFLTGNYVTLTNMSDEELDRIISYRLSPINVSVHTTDPDLRCKMLNNRFAGNILNRVKKLLDAGIMVNAQIVACPGVNDGVQLEKTLDDLLGLNPGINSISVVPVGLTKYRDGLYHIDSFDSVSANAVLEIIEKKQAHMLDRDNECLDEMNSRVVFASDEFYILAGREMPDFDAYEHFPQLENGVGMMALLKQEVENVLDAIKSEHGVVKLSEHRKVTVATGEIAYTFMLKLCKMIEKTFDGLEINVVKVTNEFFGGHVTVTGLLTGSDLIKGLEGKELGDALVLSDSMLRANDVVFLDDISIEHLEKKFEVPILFNDNTGISLISMLSGLELEEGFDE